MNKKAVSLILGGLLLINLCGALPAISESETPAASVEHSPDDRYYYEVARDYFGIEDPYKVYYYSDTRATILFMKIDNEFKKMFAEMDTITQTNRDFYDFFTKEKIFNSLKNYQNSYGYFEEGTIIEYITADNFYNSYGQPRNKNSFDNLDVSGEFTAVNLVKAMLEIYPNMEDWYAKDKGISLDYFEYKNIVPSINDNKLIEKRKFKMLLRINPRIEKDIPNFDKIIFLNIEYIVKEDSKVEDIFWGTEIKFNYKGELPNLEKKQLNDYLEGKNSRLMLYGENLLEIFLQKYTRPLRQCIEVIDGVEYYNVGKLRKLYENLPDEVRYDYTTGPFRQPSGGETDAGQRRALRLGDRGEAVLALKQRFYELGYFRTEKFNDQYTQNTADTVRLFEKNNGLPVDGIADAEMLALLFSDKAVGK